ncbi:MAG: YjgP/YjgQ family permease [Bacteroidetes bacterium]|nr:YjgP/YjgQ family permease [Bacteroidota bacterium]
MIPTLWKYVTRQIVLAFLPAVFCFMITLEFVDLFTNINRYISNNVAVIDILKIFLLYIPKTIAYSLSPALLFSGTFVLAGLYSNNELISILNAGISYKKLVIPVIAIGIIMSLFSFIFNEYVVISTFKMKNELSSELLGFSNSFNNSQIVIKTKSNNTNENYIIYYAKYYDDEQKKINDAVILFTDDDNRLTQRIDASWGIYKENGFWELYNALIYSFSNSAVSPQFLETYSEKSLSLHPDYMRNTSAVISELEISEARRLLERVEQINFIEYRSYYTDYLERFSFSFTPLIVIMISSAFAWRFKKNILLFSILLSLSISILYYVIEMISILLAKQGFISPALGAWFPFVIFFLFGALLLNSVKT